MRVLFVCTGNKFRSPVAEALWGKLRTDRAASAGTSEASAKGGKVPQRWQEFAASHGVELERHRSRQIGEARELMTYSLLVGMQPSHVNALNNRLSEVRPRRRPRIVNLGELAGVKKIPDPAFLYPGEWRGVWDLMSKALLALAIEYAEEERQ